MGLADEQIQEMEDRQAELLAGDEDEADEDEDDDPRHPVLEENWDAAQIFLRVHLERQVDQGISVYTGVRTEEIERWLEIQDIEPRYRLEVIDSVQVMVRHACPELNRRIAEQARQQMEQQRQQARQRAPSRGRKR
jgi:hypothetical protein